MKIPVTEIVAFMGIFCFISFLVFVQKQNQKEKQRVGEKIIKHFVRGVPMSAREVHNIFCSTTIGEASTNKEFIIKCLEQLVDDDSLIKEVVPINSGGVMTSRIEYYKP